MVDKYGTAREVNFSKKFRVGAGSKILGQAEASSGFVKIVSVAFGQAQESQSANCIVFVGESFRDRARKQRQNVFCSAAPNKNFGFEKANAPNPVVAKVGGANGEGLDVLQCGIEIALFELKAYARVFGVVGNGLRRPCALMAAKRQKK
ncbi:MAG TPA: hypothetical protein VKP58_10755 [Candidatus Acidoferrum sp.]|nr:hypothetical protein [Candidatus Acidoferrum sp.]